MSKLTAPVMEGFVNSVLRKNFDKPAATPWFHKEIWELVTSNSKQVAIAAPRYHAKSTAVTHAYTLASVLFRESRYVLIVSDTVTQAVQFLGDIKKELLDNDDLRALFSVSSFPKDTEDDLIVEMEDGYTFRIQAKGSEQKLRGLKWANLRPDLVIGDDMENDEIVMNKDRRMKFKRWFYGALIPCISSSGKIRIVGTILHLDSLLENLMPSSQLAHHKGHKMFIQEDLKEYSLNKLPWKSVKYRAHTDDFKTLLWPEMKSAEDFRMQKEDYVRQGLADVYSQEMLNIPLDIGDTFFKKTDFVPMKPEDQKKKLVYYATCDLAVSQAQRADYSAFVVGGMDEEGRLYCKHVIKERMDALEIVDTILMIQKIYKPVLFGLEQGTIQKAIGPYLNEEMLKRGEFINTVLLKPSGDKLTRARSIQARMRSGACKFDKDTDWYQGFEDELLRFPRDKHDDQVDAWAYLGLMLDRMWEAPTEKEIEEEEYEAYIRDNNVVDSGRSAVCGY
ncbi:Archaeophage PsiM2, terminase large subunit [uncultured Caudovirales phage]|uniref:Archaeophage PsiM2, terminase large subunit n=1 Tax=uncultured Caudovirales phage TaxID=2100421 RepID=A0A6J5LE55_9CAUD|nr:Archaeophage PsiM2, terminase large subunit [uncultured Caudovirales phage]